ncbi:uncharacterized protein [Penaeus vannamei]|uniref:uncharacterized protein isoform X2 n=1 Tax=Penaeus vannamei TaxID=6689 RepID=UPI00387FA598
MPWRLILLLYGAVVSAAAEGFSYQNGCKVRPSITAVLRSGSTLDFEAFVSSQAVTITIPQPGKMIKIFLSNKTPLLTAPGYSKVSPVLLRGWKRFKIEVDWRFLMVEKGGALVVGEQENRQLGLDLVSDVRVVISGSALMGNCERGGPVWDIYNEGVTTVTIFNEDFSDKNFTIFSSDFFIVHLEICSEGFVLTGHRRFDFTLQFDRVKMTVTPVILRPRFQRLHDPIFCHERYIDLRFSPRIADPILTLTLNRSNSEVKGDHVSTRPFWMPSGTTDERGFSAGDERVTSSHTKHLGDLDSGSSNASGTSSDTKHLGDLDSGSSNATGTSSHTNHTENLPSSPSANPVTTEDTTFDPRGPTFPVVTILSGEQVTTPRVLPEGGETTILEDDPHPPCLPSAICREQQRLGRLYQAGRPPETTSATTSLSSSESDADTCRRGSAFLLYFFFFCGFLLFHFVLCFVFCGFLLFHFVFCFVFCRFSLFLVFPFLFFLSPLFLPKTGERGCQTYPRLLLHEIYNRSR